MEGAVLVTKHQGSCEPFVFAEGDRALRQIPDVAASFVFLLRDSRGSSRIGASLVRLRWTPGSETATYSLRDGHDDKKADILGALDFVAGLLAHVPDPRRHLVHYYAYSNVVRGRPKARNQTQQADPLDSGPPLSSATACRESLSSAALRRGWTRFLRRA